MKESRWARSSAQADVDVGSIGAVTITTLDPPASVAHGAPARGCAVPGSGDGFAEPVRRPPLARRVRARSPRCDRRGHADPVGHDRREHRPLRPRESARVLRRRDDLQRPGRADRPRGRGPAPPRRDARRPGRDRAAELPAARRRVLRGAAARGDRRRAQPALHRPRAAPPVRGPPGALRDRVGQGLRHRGRVPVRPEGRAHRQRRHHRGDAVGHPVRAAPADGEGAQPPGPS